MTDDSQRPGEPTPPPAAPQYQAPQGQQPGQAYPAAPQYNSAPQYNAAPPAGQGQVVPGKTLGIVSLVLGLVGFFIIAFAAPIAGIITGVIAGRQSKAAGVKNTPAKAGLIISIVALVLQIIGVIIFAVVIGGVVSQCADLGPGVHEIDGMTYTCG